MFCNLKYSISPILNALLYISNSVCSVLEKKSLRIIHEELDTLHYAFLLHEISNSLLTMAETT